MVPNALSRIGVDLDVEPAGKTELMTVLVEPSFLERVSQHTFDIADEEMAHHVMLARSENADFRIV